MSRKPLKHEGRAFLRELGDTIRAVRREQRLHQGQLGARSGIGASRIGEIERGCVDTSVSRLNAIATALGMTASALLKRRELLVDDGRAREVLDRQLAAGMRRLGTPALDLLARVAEELAQRVAEER